MSPVCVFQYLSAQTTPNSERSQTPAGGAQPEEGKSDKKGDKSDNDEGRSEKNEVKSEKDEDKRDDKDEGKSDKSDKSNKENVESQTEVEDTAKDVPAGTRDAFISIKGYTSLPIIRNGDWPYGVGEVDSRIKVDTHMLLAC